MLFLLALLAVPCVSYGQENLAGSLAHYQAGEKFLEQNNHGSAEAEFLAALNGDREPKWVVVWSYIRLSAVYERRGQRDRSLQMLRAARHTGDDTRGAQALIAALAPNPSESQREALTAHLRIQPEYSEEALAAGLEGVVLLRAVRSEGRTDFRVSEGLGLNLEIQALRKAVELGQGLAVDDLVVAEFVLPQRESRWHLVEASFQPPPGVTRPRFRRTLFPPGAGLSNDAKDHAQIVHAMGRRGFVTLRFVVDEKGRPGEFEVVQASDPMWAREALTFVVGWEFAPAMKNGWPVAAPGVITLAWGDRAIPAESLRHTLRTAGR
ncbi:MAG: energy transducer TonB [Bryobacterales bacterium]|nr:energy transducer TonB [Bryobacterales bacterium]